MRSRSLRSRRYLMRLGENAIHDIVVEQVGQNEKSVRSELVALFGSHGGDGNSRRADPTFSICPTPAGPERARTKLPPPRGDGDWHPSRSLDCSAALPAPSAARLVS